MSCSICCDAFNASKRKPIICPFDACSRTACRTCYETFLCGDDVSVPKCIFCNTSFTHSQVQHLGFTKSFLTGDFAKHQQDILFAQEQAMLPAAQAAVAHDRLIAGINAQIKDVVAQIKQLQALKDDLYRTKTQLMRQGPDQVEDVQQFVHRCADSDCNGFVSSAWKCATCDKHTCAHCRELKASRDDDAHVCNPDTLASVALLKKDTKPCPNCKVLVHKTEGCDQMFCTQCKRLWSWNTGRFEVRGHNPHYLQWMRENAGGMPREPNDVLCGREVDAHFLSLIQSARRQIQDQSMRLEVDRVYAIISSIPHLRFYELPRLQVDRINMNLKYRKAFVSNSISLARFKQVIRRNHLNACKNEHIAQIVQAVIMAATDIAFRFLHDIQAFNLNQHNNHTQFSHLQELSNLITYANHQIQFILNDFIHKSSLSTSLSMQLRLLLS